MISAAEARTLAGPSVEELVATHLEVLNERITKAAQSKKREVILRDEPYAYWMYSREQSDDVVTTLQHLRDKGFTVDLFYEERQFVDMGLRIRW
jgi:histidyl-tRNA synthetase